MYLRTLHVRARLFSLIAVAAIVFAIVVMGYVAIRYQQFVAGLPAGTSVGDVDSEVVSILRRAAPLVVPALIIFVVAETLAWRNEAALHQERRHLELLTMQRQYIDAINAINGINGMQPPPVTQTTQTTPTTT